MSYAVSAHAAPIVRDRRVTPLFAGSALMNAAMATTSAAGGIAAAHRWGLSWGGIPATAGIVGTGIGAGGLSRLMARRGYRAGLVLGYTAAVAGAVLGSVATARGDIAALVLAMLLLGFGNAAAQLSRYVAADGFPRARRGRVIGMVVWAGAFGAVAGPLLIGPTGSAASRLGLVAASGSFLVAAPACAGAVAAVARASADPAVTRRTAPAGATPFRDLLSARAARRPLAVMATAQVVMVAVMTTVPIDMNMTGSGLGVVGMVVSAHTLGMFALSPLTGRLVDNGRSYPVMLAGLITMAVATAPLMMAASLGRLTLGGLLFLLGFGWNLAFVAGSARLAEQTETADRTSLEGAVDAGVWGVAAIAGAVGGAILAHGGYAVLAASAVALAVLPVCVLAAPDHDGRCHPTKTATKESK